MKEVKQFDASNLPKNWEVRTLDKFGVFSKGKGITKAELIPVGIPCIRYGEIYTVHHYIINEFHSFISENGAKESREIKKGDILFAGSGETIEEIGKSVAFIGNEKAYAGGDIIILSTNENIIVEFLSYALETDNVKRQKRRLGQGNSVVHIYSKDLSKLNIVLPPKEEQRAISNILSKMDAAINANNKLIDQKEIYKKYVEQNLLSGRKRLNGFDENWKEYHIKDIAKQISIKNKEDKQLTVLSCTKYDGLVPSLEYFGRKIYSDNLTSYKIVAKNHFAYATNHIEEGSIGYQENYPEALISPMYTIFKTGNLIDDSFFYKLLKSHRLIYEYNARMEGSINRRGGLRWNNFSMIKVIIPSIKEQKYIANVVNKLGDEIEILKDKKEKLEEQKKGIMQLLLTGKKRLKIK